MTYLTSLEVFFVLQVMFWQAYNRLIFRFGTRVVRLFLLGLRKKIDDSKSATLSQPEYRLTGPLTISGLACQNHLDHPSNLNKFSISSGLCSACDSLRPPGGPCLTGLIDRPRPP